MSDATIANKAMEGSGFYNRNSGLQAAAIEMVLPLLREAAEQVPIKDEGSLVIADYGSSQGRNSMAPMRVAIEALRSRAGADRVVEVIHTDLPGNDFAALFTAVESEPDSYRTGRSGVFTSAVGRSYFEAILPPGKVLLGWNTWTLHWLSRSPIQSAEHVSAILSPLAGERSVIEEQLGRDWITFLKARSTEMAPGARLVLLCMGRGDNVHGWEWVLGKMWQAAVSMAQEGLVSADEIRRLTLPAAGRRSSDLHAPFEGGNFCGLVLDHAEIIEAPDPFWDEYLTDGDAVQFGRRWSGTLRAVAGPIASDAFAAHSDAAHLVDELFRRMEDGVVASPQRHEHFIAVATLRKL